MVAEPMINYVAVVVAAISQMVIGSFWYGPVFGKTWMQLSGFTKKSMEEAKKKGMTQLYVFAFIGSLVMSFVLAHFVDYMEVTTVAGAARLAFWLWLGFIATVMLGSVLWEQKSWKLYAIGVVYQYLALFVMAIILTLWV